MKVDFSANCSIGIPLYSKIPLSPSMYEMREVLNRKIKCIILVDYLIITHEIVFIKAGS